MELTLLERWDKDSHTTGSYYYNEIRRAIAIAQAVDEACGGQSLWSILRRADELLKGEK